MQLANWISNHAHPLAHKFPSGLGESVVRSFQPQRVHNSRRPSCYRFLFMPRNVSALSHSLAPILLRKERVSIDTRMVKPLQAVRLIAVLATIGEANSLGSLCSSSSINSSFRRRGRFHFYLRNAQHPPPGSFEIENYATTRFNDEFTGADSRSRARHNRNY